MADKYPHLKIVKPTTEAQKETRTTSDVIIVTPEIVRAWKLPKFQRALKVNEKLVAIAQDIKETEIIPGIITLGVLDKIVYLLDGQHRREAFLQSEAREAAVDVRYAHFDSLAEMADEYVKLNSRIVNMTADDMLRGLCEGHDELMRVSEACKFVGFGQVRRNPGSPVVSMSALLRCWFGSSPEVPALGGLSAAVVANRLTPDETPMLIEFANLAYKAWGSEPSNHKLWLNLNLAISMWLYRRLCITPYSASTKKLSKDMFVKCLMSVAADGSYSDWLVGRAMRERDRAPAYSKVKSLFARRIEMETGVKPRLPSPDWGGR